MTYRSFLELTVNTVPLNPKAVTCIGLGLGCRGARSANNRPNTQQLNICYCWTRVGISSSPHIFFSTLDISLCKTVIGFLYWMVLETYSISWGNDSVFFVMLIFWLLLVSSGVNIDLLHGKKTMFCSPFWFYISTCIVPLNQIFSQPSNLFSEWIEHFIRIFTHPPLSKSRQNFWNEVETRYGFIFLLQVLHYIECEILQFSTCISFNI